MHKKQGLPDFLCKGLSVVSIGINPSLHSVQSGYPFSSPRNRFWRAFNQSKLIDSPVVPSPEALQVLMRQERIGFTDIVKRPTRGISELKASDYIEGAELLSEKLLNYQPTIAWFQGMTAARHFYKYKKGAFSEPQWGLQKEKYSSCLVFVSPNPSPANAAFSFSDLLGFFDELAELKATL